MTGVRINQLGPVTELTREGTQIDNHVSSSGFMPFKAQSVWTHTTSSALTSSGGFDARPGPQVISGVNALTIVLPSPSLNPGALFGFRVASAQAHILTASADTAGTRTIVANDGVLSGSSCTLMGAVGANVLLYCDGAKFLMTAGSGSVTGA